MSADAGAAAPAASSAAAAGEPTSLHEAIQGAAEAAAAAVASAEAEEGPLEVLHGSETVHIQQSRLWLQATRHPIRSLAFCPGSRTLCAATGHRVATMSFKPGHAEPASRGMLCFAPPVEPVRLQWCQRGGGDPSLCTGGMTLSLITEGGGPPYLEPQEGSPPACEGVSAAAVVRPLVTMRALGDTLELWGVSGRLDSKTASSTIVNIACPAKLPSANLVVVQTQDERIRYWRISTAESGDPTPYRLLPRRSMAVSVHRECDIASWRFMVAGAAGTGHPDYVQGHGRLLLVCSTHVRTFAGHRAPITNVAIGPVSGNNSNVIVLSADRSGSVLLWRTNHRKLDAKLMLTVALPGPVRGIDVESGFFLAMAYAKGEENKLAVLNLGDNAYHKDRTYCIDGASGLGDAGRSMFDQASFDEVSHRNLVLRRDNEQLSTRVAELEEQPAAAAAAPTTRDIAEVCAEAERADRPSYHCSICLEHHKAVTLVPCGHRLGARCLARCAESSRACPICRTEIVCVVQTVEDPPPAIVVDDDEEDEDSSGSGGGSAAGSKRPASDLDPSKRMRST